MQYSTLGIVINDMVIRYGESFWPGINPRPGEDGSYEDQPQPCPNLLKWMGGFVARLFPFAASSRVTGWSTCNLFYSLSCIIPTVIITNAN